MIGVKNPSQLLNVAHLLMAFCLFVTVMAITFVYGFGESFSLGLNILGHISIIVFPAFFKLGYILRLHSLKQLGLPVN